MKEPISSGKKLTKIEKDVIFKGSLEFQDQLNVFGQIEGTIKSDNSGEIYIDAIGIIDGDVSTGTIENRGTLKGSAKVDKYFLYNTGKSNCNLYTKEIMVEKGAKITGQFHMESDN